MWVIELNVAGHRFTRAVSDVRRQHLRGVRFSRRSLHWPVPQARRAHAA
ncbi:hypothetical protein JMUB5695_04492 [Mycobacterium heckeshornense]|uniref:Uncharacterized protein n=1 Tax=Mycobacterium heckeshornense TaxID=110505 RepID=A0A7R7TZ98_9MYCO|nr:hypothetical protein MHEC_46110 [Mycobacterium heckeshornense]BCQ11031.1 hypothetical protein JMUB5695_04492 [Mycobacterium heckeshornense]